MSNESFSQGNQYKELSQIGSRLRNAREELCLTVTDVSRQLRLTEERIESLENDDYQTMPGITFVKGYLRAYAHLVNLPADELIADFDRLKPMPEIKSFIVSSRSRKQPILKSNKSMRWIIYLIGIGLLVLAATWWSSVISNDPANQNLMNSKHQPANNMPSTNALTNPTPPPATVNEPKNSDNAASSAEPAKTPGSQGEEAANVAPAAAVTPPTTENQQAVTPSSENTSPATTSSASPQSPETNAPTAEKNTANTTDENSDEPKPAKKKPAREAHSRSEFADSADDDE